MGAAASRHDRPPAAAAAAAAAIRASDLARASPSLVLCRGATQLFRTTPADRGWACGYRNCQMLLSSTLGAGAEVPGVADLQRVLEQAWRAGYDPEGAAQLGHRVAGTRKWIGATEVYCILAQLGASPHVVDFHRPTAADGSHPALLEWIVAYFTDAPPPPHAAAARHPLYLQHQGHSRTVVGVDLAADPAPCLLVFDPDASPRRPGPDGFPHLPEFRLRLADTRRAAQYQIVYVDPAPPPHPPPRRIASVRIP
ncbi:hypothetical protein H4R18_003167 [Coemansia javaensis]|uniref:UFSP1/2/DUB catalytic domain-containing protein n=1 Tax=Coemansia javaensis TaxID=2761396 RepID=A0A9W8LI51_9FUNG|nr:hypothetical protein H4R18_003167 [Coemansia javaensis]